MSGDKFADHQAAEIHRLRKLVDKLRHDMRWLRSSRDLWRHRALNGKEKRR